MARTAAARSARHHLHRRTIKTHTRRHASSDQPQPCRDKWQVLAGWAGGGRGYGLCKYSIDNSYGSSEILRYQAEIHALHTACCSLMTGVTTSDSPHLCCTAASALYPKLHPRSVTCLSIFESSLQLLSSGRDASGWLLVLLGGVRGDCTGALGCYLLYCHQHHSVFSPATGQTIHSIFIMNGWVFRGNPWLLWYKCHEVAGLMWAS